MGRRHREAARAVRADRKEARQRERDFANRFTEWSDSLPLEQQWELEDVAVAGREDEFRARAAYFGWVDE